MTFHSLSYAQRATYCSNSTAQQLLLLMEQKKTNLAVSLDLTHKINFLALAEALGPEICVLKTHIDTLEEFDPSVTAALTHLAKKHQFLIFEDRKFADIGHTVQLQYGSGVYRIADWADITNAHILPGQGIVEGLKKIGLSKGRGLLLLAQMSSKGNLIDSDYTETSVAIAEQHKDFVIGFVALEKISIDPTWIHFTPGIHQANTSDATGQQYVSPEEAILTRGTDVIIVGRGIYQADDPVSAARAYRKVAWSAYQRRIQAIFS